MTACQATEMFEVTAAHFHAATQMFAVSGSIQISA